MRRMGLAALGLLGWISGLDAADIGSRAEPPAALSLVGEIRPLVRSDDGRYAMSADLRMTPEDSSADGRFALKAINAPEAGCEIDGVFANGFE
jgi:hypothetical protein